MQSNNQQQFRDVQIIYDFIILVWDYSMGRDSIISYRDGNPSETFFDEFNIKFSKNEDLHNFLIQAIERIMILNDQSKQRMQQIEDMYNSKLKQKHQNLGRAFFQLMRYYHKEQQYKDKYGQYLMLDLVGFNNNVLRDQLLLFIKKSVPNFHQGLDFIGFNKNLTQSCPSLIQYIMQ